MICSQKQEQWQIVFLSLREAIVTGMQIFIQRIFWIFEQSDRGAKKSITPLAGRILGDATTKLRECYIISYCLTCEGRGQPGSVRPYDWT